MAKFHDGITEEQAALIRRAPLFFVASAHPELLGGMDGVGPVNVSPKGGVPLHIVSPNRVAYLDTNGSGNETARHGRLGGPVTVMVCSFDGPDAAIVRLYGRASVTPAEASTLGAMLLASARELMSSPRQVVEIEIARTMTSCGYGVPVMSVVRERQKADRGRRYS